jgi:hypothetical protein
VYRTSEGTDRVVVPKFESNIRVQREFRYEYDVRPPDDKNIRRWCVKFKEIGSVEKNIHSTGWPRRSGEDVDRVRRAFIRSPVKSISGPSAEIQTSQTTVHRILTEESEV